MNYQEKKKLKRGNLNGSFSCKCYMLCDSNKVFWKRQNCKDSEIISGYQGFRVEHAKKYKGCLEY